MWKAVTCIENHDIVKDGSDLRVARLSDGSNARSWYARSRARVASALLLFAPGIPQIFMGQEFLEDKQWSDDPKSPLHLWWDGLGRRSFHDQSSSLYAGCNPSALDASGSAWTYGARVLCA